jgi:phage recombination protein Bet
MNMANALVKYEYETDKGMVSLDANTVRNYLVPADSRVTDQEVVMFLELCKYQKLNPFTREAYLVKYGNYAASIVTGKEVFTQRAQQDQRFAGIEAGITILTKDNQLIRRDGSLLLPQEKDRLVGGWAKVYIKGYAVPMFDEVSLVEYIGKKSDGTPTKMWAEKPATMIRKVALVHALREAFPDKFKGLYSQEEINTIDTSTLPTTPVAVPEPAKPKAQKVQQTAVEAPVVQQETIKDITPEQEDPVPEQPQAEECPECLGGGTIPAPTKDCFDEVESQQPDPSSFTIGFGKYSGKTIREIAAKDRGYIEWLSREAKNSDIRKACEDYLIKYAKPAATKSKGQGRQAWPTDVPDEVAPWEDGYVPPEEAPPES